jgi:hypothetical protein
LEHREYGLRPNRPHDLGHLGRRCACPRLR